jgi:hypothetical protein
LRFPKACRKELHEMRQLLRACVELEGFLPRRGSRAPRRGSRAQSGPAGGPRMGFGHLWSTFRGGLGSPWPTLGPPWGRFWGPMRSTWTNQEATWRHFWQLGAQKMGKERKRKGVPEEACKSTEKVPKLTSQKPAKSLFYCNKTEVFVLQTKLLKSSRKSQK